MQVTKSQPRACGDGPVAPSRSPRQVSSAPRMWGWTVGDGGVDEPTDLSPAHVGMDRRRRHPHQPARPQPRACGDGPHSSAGLFRSDASAPRMWGWTGVDLARAAQCLLSPAHVGMDRAARTSDAALPSQPRACGDGPRPLPVAGGADHSAPRMWGWTDLGEGHRAHLRLSPAHVGMDRRAAPAAPVDSSQPHACGDGPVLVARYPEAPNSAPRVWGWTVVRRRSGRVCALRAPG